MSDVSTGRLKQWADTCTGSSMAKEIDAIKAENKRLLSALAKIAHGEQPYMLGSTHPVRKLAQATIKEAGQ